MFSMNFHDMFFESRTLHRGLSMFWCHTKESCPWQTFRPRHLSCWRCSITALGGNHRLTKLETNNGKKGLGLKAMISIDIGSYIGAARPMLCCHWMRDGLYMWKRIACTYMSSYASQQSAMSPWSCNPVPMVNPSTAEVSAPWSSSPSCSHLPMCPPSILKGVSPSGHFMSFPPHHPDPSTRKVSWVKSACVRKWSKSMCASSNSFVAMMPWDIHRFAWFCWGCCSAGTLTSLPTRT